MLLHERQPHELLMSLLDGGMLESTTWRWAEEIRQNPERFYARDVVSYGQEEAERRLEAFIKNDTIVGNAVAQVASGMLELALADDTLAGDAEEEDEEKPKPLVEVKLIDDSVKLPEISRSYRGGALVIARNPSLPGCGCSQPEGSAVFGRGGVLGLQAIGLAVESRGYNPRILLVLPHPNFKAGSSRNTGLGLSVVSFTTDGHVSSSSVQYQLYHDVLNFSLGRTSADQMIGGSGVSSGVQVALNFPDAQEYFTKHISNLGGYLEDAANVLTGVHTHG